MRIPKLGLRLAPIFAVTLGFAASVLWLFGNGSAREKTKYDQKPAISRAAFADSLLWMMSDDGALVSLAPSESTPTRIEVQGKIVDMCRSEGRLLVLVEADQGHWSIQRRSSAGWDLGPLIASEKESLAALGCADGSSAIVIVTNRRLVEVNGPAVRTVELSEDLKLPPGIGTALIVGNTVWVGFNAGEWGGGLRRIARDSGEIEDIESNLSGELCGGPLNMGCDPVTGIVPSPTDSNCVVAAVGLVHFMSHGRIVEVCGKTVRRLNFKPVDPQPPYGKLDDGEPASTTAFFGLARVGNIVLALGTDGLYKFSGSAPPQFRPLPRFEDKGGYQVSSDVPGIMLVMTGVNQRRSLSGMVPIMAAR